jgi:F420-non-reducing hydrogenase iron-sulfur subunit
MSEQPQPEDQSTDEQGASGRRVLAFVCKWCTSGASEAYGRLRRPDLPQEVQLVRVPCTGAVDAAYILRAFLEGADAVLVSGCWPGDCHYVGGNLRARRRVAVVKSLLRTFGLQDERVSLTWIATSQATKFRETLNQVADEARRLGPNPIASDAEVWPSV